MDKKINLEQVKEAALTKAGWKGIDYYNDVEVKILRDQFNGDKRFKFKVIVLGYTKNRTNNVKFEFFGDTKKGIYANMLNHDCDNICFM